MRAWAKALLFAVGVLGGGGIQAAGWPPPEEGGRYGGGWDWSGGRTPEPAAPQAQPQWRPGAEARDLARPSPAPAPSRDWREPWEAGSARSAPPAPALRDPGWGAEAQRRAVPGGGGSGQKTWGNLSGSAVEPEPRQGPAMRPWGNPEGPARREPIPERHEGAPQLQLPQPPQPPAWPPGYGYYPGYGVYPGNSFGLWPGSTPGLWW